MKKLNWPSIYAYIICIAMLITFIFAAQKLVRSGLNLIFPKDETIRIEQMIKPNPNVKQITIAPDARELYVQTAKAFDKQSNMKDLISGVLMILMITPVYLYHWRLGNKYRLYAGGSITVRDIYFYLGALITLIVGVTASVSLIDVLVRYAIGSYPYLPGLESLIYKRPPDTNEVVITKDMVQTLIRETSAANFPRDSILSQLTMVLVAAPLYVFHWGIAKKLHPLE
ncbi:MAG: hypothetical protein ACYCVD_04765 [Desulfitobacteriaceae bacterium]